MTRHNGRLRSQPRTLEILFGRAISIQNLHKPEPESSEPMSVGKRKTRRLGSLGGIQTGGHWRSFEARLSLKILQQSGVAVLIVLQCFIECLQSESLGLEGGPEIELGVRSVLFRYLEFFP